MNANIKGNFVLIFSFSEIRNLISNVLLLFRQLSDYIVDTFRGICVRFVCLSEFQPLLASFHSNDVYT